MPVLDLPSFLGAVVSLRMVHWQACVFYFYPGIGSPGAGRMWWHREDEAQHRGYAAHRKDLAALGVTPVGVSSEPRTVQGLAYKDLGVRDPLFSDPECKLASLLGLPTLTVGEQRFYDRLTLLTCPPQGIVERVFYPVRAPERDAARVLDWLRSHLGSR